MERQRKAQARHLALLSRDAPVMNRCAKEEAHLKQRLAQSTAVLTRSARQNQAAAEREERARTAQLQAQFSAILTKTPEVRVPGPDTTTNVRSAAEAAPVVAVESVAGSKPRAAAECARSGLPVAPSHPAAAAEGVAAPSSSSPACFLGFPEPFKNSGFKSVVHWASVSYDETFLTAYGPRRLREELQTGTVAAAGGAPTARDARPHRLLAAVACYLLNEVLCADAAVSSLWQEKLRQPIFDAVFSSQSIAAGEQKRRACQCVGPAGNEATRSNAIVLQSLGPAAVAAPSTSAEGDVETCAAAASPASFAPPPLDTLFPPRTNVYASRDDFATMRLWTEEVTAEQREKAIVCRRVRSLQQVMERRMELLQVYQRQRNEAILRSIFTVWRTNTRQCRARRIVMERYLENRHCRVLEESVFLRWRRVTLQAKVESLQRRMLNMVAEHVEAARKSAAALAAVQEQVSSERRRHQQAAFEQDALHTQILESHSMEVEALRLVLHQQRSHASEVGKWAKRWERLAKTFRPATACPAVSPSMWTLTLALYSSEEKAVAKVLGKGGDRRVLKQMPYSMMLPVRERLEGLLLAWVNAVMEKSPLAASWVPLEKFMHGSTTHPVSILVSQKAETDAPSRARTTAATGANIAAESFMSEFGVYTLMEFVRELRRLYILAGKLSDPDIAESRLTSNCTALSKCFRDVVQLLSVQTCAGLYPSLLTHCPSLSRWFTPAGIFGGPTNSFEGAGRERRLQHTMFVWLLTALLVGHIRMVILAPAGEKDDGLPHPASSAASLRCSREAVLETVPQINFPVKRRAAAAAAAAIAALPEREEDTDTSTSAGGPSAPSLGTSIVAQNTLLSKRPPNAANSKVSIASSEPTRSVITGESGASTAGSPRRADGAEALLKGVVTLETALRERSQQAGAPLTDGEDSLSDIEAYLGLLSTQARTLRRSGSNHAKATGTAGPKETVTGDGTSNKEDDDDFVKRLLQQLVEARDAAARHRRIRRMQGAAASTHPTHHTQVPFSAFPNNDSVDDDEDDEWDAQEDAAAGNCFLHPPIEDRTSAILTEEQLIILRSLPSRSRAFDVIRSVCPPAPAPSSPHSLSSDAPNTAAVSSTDEPSGMFYSFLLNMLEDVKRRQQWAGVARVVTSLVVRFHILDDANDGGQRANKLLANRADMQKEESFSRRRLSTSLPSFNTASSSLVMLPQSARLPAVPTSTTAAARDAAASKPRTTNSVDNSNNAAATEGASSARDKSHMQRVAAKLVPLRPSPSHSLSTTPDAYLLAGFANHQTSLHLSVASVGEDLLRSTPSATDSSPQPADKDGSSARGFAPPASFASVSPPHSKNGSNSLLSAHEMHVLNGKMRVRRKNTAAVSAAVSNSQRTSASADNTSDASPQRPLHDEKSSFSAPSSSALQLPLQQLTLFSSEISALRTSPRDAVVCSDVPPRRQDVQEDHEEEALGAERREASASLKIPDLSILSTPQETGTEVSHERVLGTTCRSDATALQDSRLHEPHSHSSFVDPPSPPAMKERKGTMQPSACEADNASRHPTAPSAQATVPQTRLQTSQTGAQLHLSSLPPPQREGARTGPAAAPLVLPPVVSNTTVDSAAAEAKVEEGEGTVEGDTLRSPLGYLDPLIEHGAPQSSAATENIRKDRFHLQP